MHDNAGKLINFNYFFGSKNDTHSKLLLANGDVMEVALKRNCVYDAVM